MFYFFIFIFFRLPAEVDATKITSTLSVDGFLSVEAPVPETAVPAATIIPIKVIMFVFTVKATGCHRSFIYLRITVDLLFI